MTNISPTAAASLGRIEPGSPVSVEAREAPEAPARRGADRPADRVEVSDMARLLAKLNQMPDIRTELVDKARADITAGRYETDEKIELAIDALFDELDSI
ncbi:MAG: flagellar biosynthesis anti-sigma factor FlgM [Planctomycetota bacterium]